jgi:hypothetical protein
MVFPLPPFGSNGLVGSHGFTAVTRWVEVGQPLFQRELGIGDRGNHDLSISDGNAHPLIDVQMCFARDGGRQADAEIVAPLLDAENDFGHDGLLKTITFKL